MLNKKFAIFLFILFSSIPSLLSIGQNASDIESVIENAEKSGLAVTFNRRVRALPILFNPLATALATLSVTTAIKIGFLYSISVWLLSVIYPKLLNIIGLKTGLVNLRSVRSTLMPPIDLEAMSETMRTIPEKLLAYLDIPEEECRYRAVCESATYISTKFPLINDWVKKISGALFLNIANPYSRAWINGMMQIDCTATYVTCSESPFRKLLYKIMMRR